MFLIISLVACFPSSVHNLGIEFSCHISLASFNLEMFPQPFFVFWWYWQFWGIDSPFENRLFLILYLSDLFSWLDWSHAFAVGLLHGWCSVLRMSYPETHSVHLPPISDVHFNPFVGKHFKTMITSCPSSKFSLYLASIDNSCLIQSLRYCKIMIFQLYRSLYVYQFVLDIPL